jgi:heat shock protein HslJ
VANPDRALAGPIWTIDTLIDGGAASNVPTSTPPTLRFGSDGTIEVFTGCNTGTGSYTREGLTLGLSAIPYTLRGCAAAETSVEAHVTRVFNAGAVTFEVDAARLSIQRGDVGIRAITE